MNLTLSRLLENLAPVPETLDRPIRGISSDSRRVQAGDLFLAVPGLRRHGLEFYQQVRQAGAAAVVYEPSPAPLPPADAACPLLPVADLGRHLGRIAARFHGHPARDLTLIGITGTDGKTSCAHYLAQALDHCGVLGTAGYGLPGRLRPASHTTPDALDLQDWLARLRDDGARRVAMEVSSHALDQNRVRGLRFRVALFTQLSRDHLDYHGTLEAYAAAKRKLFDTPELGCAVLNLDDAHGRAWAGSLRGRVPVLGYGFGELSAERWVRGLDLRLDGEGLDLTVRTSQGRGRIAAPLLGRFNAANLLGVLGVLLALDLDLDTALDRLRRLRPVPGRMERFQAHGRPTAVVDYAHTPHALEQALTALREHCRGRLWCVFGCGGDRDAGKRPRMGAVAARLADRVVLTDDNPRGEDPAAIIQAIRAGMDHADGVRVITPRGEALCRTLDQAGPEDIVLIAGKGHEDYQLIGEQRLAYSDREVVQQWLN